MPGECPLFTSLKACANPQQAIKIQTHPVMAGGKGSSLHAEAFERDCKAKVRCAQRLGLTTIRELAAQLPSRSIFDPSRKFSYEPALSCLTTGEASSAEHRTQGCAQYVLPDLLSHQRATSQTSATSHCQIRDLTLRPRPTRPINELVYSPHHEPASGACFLSALAYRRTEPWRR